MLVLFLLYGSAGLGGNEESLVLLEFKLGSTHKYFDLTLSQNCC